MYLQESVTHMAARHVQSTRPVLPISRHRVLFASSSNIEVLTERSNSHKQQIRDLLESIGVTEPLVIEASRPGFAKLPSVDEVEENLRILVDVMNISITDIKDIVQGHPELLLNQKPEVLMDRYDELLAAWPSEAQLKSSIRAYPMILGDEFTIQLQKSLSALRDIGFESKQVARIIVKQPDIVILRKFELNNVIKRLSLDINMNDEEAKLSIILRFFSRNPEALVPSHFKDVLHRCIERMHDDLGLSLSAAALAVIQHDTVYKKCTQDFESVEKSMKRLIEYCENASHAVQMVDAVPQILSMDMKRLEQTLHAAKSLSPEALVSYPRIFLHDPHEVVGPRIAFMERYWKGKSLRLATFLSIGENVFLSNYVKGYREEYDALIHEYTSKKSIQTTKEPEPLPVKQPEKKKQQQPEKPSDVSQQKTKPRRFWKKRMKRLPRLSSS